MLTGFARGLEKGDPRRSQSTFTGSLLHFPGKPTSNGNWTPAPREDTLLNSRKA
jgi:hypothetical protein